MRYFKYSEFDSPLEKGSGMRMKKSTLTKLIQAREAYGWPLRITSGFRVQADFERLKSKGYEVARNSSHFKGYAADLLDLRGMTTERFVALCDAMWNAGFRRFGIMRGALHVDDDPTKTLREFGSMQTLRITSGKRCANGLTSKNKPHDSAN
jgi:Uncharacterized protein conserved in bacteria